MFRLERTYLSLILDPLQKLFRRPSSSSEEFLAPSCNLVDLSPSPALGFPDRLKVALFLHCMKQWIERSSTKVYFEAVPDFEVDLVSPSRLCLEETEYYQVEMVLDQPFSPSLVEILVQWCYSVLFVGDDGLTPLNAFY